MSNILPHFLGDISNLPWVAIIAVSGGLVLVIVGLIGGLLFAHRRQAMWHETARLALEKGQPLPAMPEDVGPPQGLAQVQTQSDLRKGLVLVGVGLGLYLFLGTFISRSLGLVGAIPGFIGVALILYVLLNRLFTSRHPSSSDRS